ncbi:MAG: hypothetical protein GF311_13135 [Candidatus Lokiarchaeota archaeon]|nr:hypothetical protein [Candidatus Lokiarchaeota archaeon]
MFETLKQKKAQKVILQIGSAICIFGAFVITPLTIFWQLLQFGSEFQAVLMRLRMISLVNVALGFVIFSLYLIRLLYHTLSITHFIFGLLGEGLSLLYILFWSNMSYINISLGQVRLSFDISRLYLGFLVIPVFSTCRTIYIYFSENKRTYNLIILLELISRNKFNTPWKIRKYLSSLRYDDLKLLNRLKDKYNQLLKNMENQKTPLIMRRKMYRISADGKKLLEWYKNNKQSNYNEIQIIIKSIQ